MEKLKKQLYRYICMKSSEHVLHLFTSLFQSRLKKTEKSQMPKLKVETIGGYFNMLEINYSRKLVQYLLFMFFFIK